MSIKPANITKKSIQNLVKKFVKAINFDPIEQNVKDIVERLKGTTKYEDDSKWFDINGGGMVVHGKDKEPKFTIYLPKYTSTNRDNFTIAHEIGHYILHSQFGEFAFEIKRSGENIRTEWEANWFAAELLMPEDKIREDYKTLSIYELNLKYKVSISAIKVRLKSLNLGE